MQSRNLEALWQNYNPTQMAALLSTTVGLMPHGVTISDLAQPDSPLIYVNAGFERLTGYTAGEVLGRNCRFLQGEEQNQEAIPTIRRAMATGQACRVILRNYRKDGSPFWNELSLYPLCADDGILTNYIGIQYDITEIVERSKGLIQTERKAAQEAAQHAQSMTLLTEMSGQLNLVVREKDVYAIAARYVPQLVRAYRISMALLTAGNTQLEIITLNGEADATLEAQHIPYQGNDIEQAILHGSVLMSLDHDAEIIRGQHTQMNVPLVTGGILIGALYVTAHQEHAFTQRDEHLILQIASLLASTLQSRRLFTQMQEALDENKRLYIAASERSIALLNALEQLYNMQTQLVAAEKMASLGRLVAGLAHEINTPIGIALTAASVWEDRTAELWQLYRNDQLQRTDFEEFLQTITEGGRLISNNLNRAVGLMQSFKQVAVDQSSEAMRTINLKTYINEVVVSLQPELKRTQLIVTVNGDEDLVLQSDPGALSQIITNLIFNSIAHAYEPDAHGHLTIMVNQQNDQACLEYSDDGKGIPNEHHRKIFEPFFTTRRGQGGSGLGLHIVYNLVTQRLGGTISFQSQVGIGTTFTITLPILPQDSLPDSSSLSTPSPASTEESLCTPQDR